MQDNYLVYMAVSWLTVYQYLCLHPLNAQNTSTFPFCKNGNSIPLSIKKIYIGTV